MNNPLYFDIISASGGGGGSGTVTSVALSDGSTSPIYSISGSPVTTSGTLTFTLATQTTNKVLASPNGSTGQPTFRALVSADIPTALNSVTSATSLVSIGTITTGTWTGTTIAIANGGTGQTTAANAINALLPSQSGQSGNFLTTNGTVSSWAAGGGGVSSITGTTNQITASASTGAVTLSIATGYVGQSSITTLGTIGTGTWQGTLVAGQYGGTGVANTGKTITLGGNLTTSGAFATTLTATAATSVTLPTSGTLITTTVATLSSLTSVGTIGTGTWQGTLIGSNYGGTGVANGSSTLTMGGSVTFSGAFTTTLTVTAATTATLPSGTVSLGYLGLPQNSQGANYTCVLADAGKQIYNTDTSAVTFTIPANSSVAYPIGTVLVFINESSGGVVTLAITTDTLTWQPLALTGSRSIAAGGMAEAIKVTSTSWFITGIGVS